MEDRVSCPKCGEVHSSWDSLEEHYTVEHDGELEANTKDKKVFSSLKSFLTGHDLKFLAGVFVGSFITAMIFVAPAHLDQQEPVKVTVVSCEGCDYERFVNVTDRQFDVQYVELDYQSDRGMRKIEKYNRSYVPAFIFDRSVEDRENFTSIRNSVVEYEDAYVLSDRGVEVAQRFSTGKALE